MQKELPTEQQKVEVSAEEIFKVELSLNDWNVVLTGLGKLPGEVMLPVHSQLKSQVEAGIQKKAAEIMAKKNKPLTEEQRNLKSRIVNINKQNHAKNGTDKVKK